MLAISPQFCNYGWLMNDAINIIHGQENTTYFSREIRETSESPTSKIPLKHGYSAGSNSNDGSLDGGDKTVKKLNHNAIERHRRRKMNTLYANLRSLLPHEDQSKKLSIPATLSRVLKYIPELQKEVERLKQKKERLLSKISMAESWSLEFKNHRTKPNNRSSSSTASAAQINEGEVVIQTSMPKSKKGSFSEAILRLEEEGLIMVNASCFESFEGRLFYNLHFKAIEGRLIEAETLKEKLWPLN